MRTGREIRRHAFVEDVWTLVCDKVPGLCRAYASWQRGYPEWFCPHNRTILHPFIVDSAPACRHPHGQDLPSNPVTVQCNGVHYVTVTRVKLTRLAFVYSQIPSLRTIDGREVTLEERDYVNTLFAASASPLMQVDNVSSLGVISGSGVTMASAHSLFQPQRHSLACFSAVPGSGIPFECHGIVRTCGKGIMLC